MTAFAYLVFPNTTLSVLPKGSSVVESEPVEHGIITSVTYGVMSGTVITSLSRVEFTMFNVF